MGVPNINQDAGSGGLIFRPSKKVMTPSENRPKKVMTPSENRPKKVMTPSENRPKKVMTPYEIRAKIQLYQVNFG